MSAALNETDMSVATDTSAEAVERLAKSLAFVANRTGLTVEKCEEITDNAAATLRALLAERDRLREERAEVEAARREGAAAEREACARMIERSKIGQGLYRVHVAAAIRARGGA